MADHVSSKAFGVRLPNELWEAIDAEAAALEMSRNELLSRRLRGIFSRVPELRKAVQMPRYAEDAELELPS